MFFSTLSSAKHLGLPLVAASVVVTGLTVASPAQALNIVNRYEVTSALNGGDHAMAGVTGGGSADYVTTDNSNLFWEEYEDGTARFFGKVFSRNEVKSGSTTPSGWAVDAYFTKKLDGPGKGGPKKELGGSAYGTSPGKIDPSTWVFFEFSQEKASTLTGFGGGFDGKELFLTDASKGNFPLQIGQGASGKNKNFGMSTWFHALDANGNRASSSSRGHADFNVDFTRTEIPPTEVPTPAAGLAWLMTSGAAIARKRKQSRES